MQSKTLKLLVAVACVMTIATAAMAAGTTWADLTEAQQQKYMTLHDKLVKKTTPLRESLWAKNVELKALMQNDNVNTKEVNRVVAEVKELRAKMRAEREAFNAEVKNKVGIEPLRNPHGRMMNDCPVSNCGRGHGRHGGHGNGMGRGMGRGMGTGCPGMPAPCQN